MMGSLKSKINLEEAKGKPTNPPTELKKGTEFDCRVTFFPSAKMDEIVYLKTLHFFDPDTNWVSFGFKPKSKDLKTFVEDLENMQYFETNDELTTSIVLDGNKVRIGMQGASMDPFQDLYSKQADDLTRMATIMEDKQTEAILEVNLVLH